MTEHHILDLGAGVQSTALYLMAADGLPGSMRSMSAAFFMWMGVLAVFAVCCCIADPRAAVRAGAFWMAYKDARKAFADEFRYSFRERVKHEQFPPQKIGHGLGSGD